jgi:hypothetical protein
VLGDNRLPELNPGTLNRSKSLWRGTSSLSDSGFPTG